MSVNTDDIEKSEPKLTLSRAQHLLKSEIIAELRKRNIECNDTDSRNELRNTLIRLVRKEIEESIASGSGENPLDREENKSKEVGNIGSACSTDSWSTASSSESVTSSDSSSDMAGNSKIEFKLNTDDWEAFTERLELHFKLKKIDADLQTAMLLTSVDEDAYMLFKNLCAPIKPATKPYAELIDLMANHINPKPSKVMERCKFHKAKQGGSESIAEFAANLRKLALRCEFENLDDALRDQFVCGVHDENIRIELFKISELTFDNALKEALAHERAVSNAAGAERTLMRNNGNKEVFAIKHNSKPNYKAESYRQNTQKHRQSNDEKGPRRKEMFLLWQSRAFRK